jgi:hypothetical protein
MVETGVTFCGEVPIMRSSFSRLLVLTSVAVALTLSTVTHASTGFTVDGLRVRPPVGTFGGIPVRSCDLVTYAGCKIETFTVTNVGSDPILIGGFGIADLDPGTVALVPGAPGSGCDLLPLNGGYWSLQPGASCTISAAFGPVEKGLMQGELHIWYTDQFNPIAVIPLIGVGT